MNIELTQEQKTDVEERTNRFLDGYNKLVEDCSMDFGQIPQYVPIGRGMFATMIFNQPQDKKYLPQVSPLS